jgi:uncharacterized protein YnzC (UPF0291/DUF896 family)
LYTKTSPVNKSADLIPKIKSDKFPVAVQVFSGLLDCGHPAVRTWFALRAMDVIGQGWVDIRVIDFAGWLGVTRYTTYRHIANKVFFPQVHRTAEGKVRVYLAGIAPVAIALGFTTVKSLGACTEFLPEWVGRGFVSRLQSTELEAQNAQRQAYRTAIKSAKGGLERSKIIDPAKAAIAHSKIEKRLIGARDKRRKELGRSVVLRGFKSRSFRYFRIAPDQLVPGITQKDMALRLNRSVRTIRRRLSNTTRIRYGIAPLNRRRVLQKLEPDTEKHFAEYLDSIHANYASVGYGDRIIQIGRIKIGEEAPQVYRLLTNIYHFDTPFELMSARCARSRFKRAIKRHIENIKKMEQCIAA